MLGNLFRRSPRQVLGMVLGLAYGLGATLVAILGFGALRDVGAEPAGSIAVVAGSLILLAFLLWPLFFGADDALDPRRFSLLGLRAGVLARGLAAAAFLSIPALALALVAATQVFTWARGGSFPIFALVGAVLIVVTGILGARLATSIAALLLAARRARETLGLLGLVLLGALSPVIAMMVTVDWDLRGLAVLRSIAEALAWTPLGAAWAAPAFSAVGDQGGALAALGMAFVFVAVIWAAWQLTVAIALAAPEGPARVRESRGLGWFARLPGTPVGAIAARSLSYWARDARYRAALIIVPVVPVVAVAILSVAGVPSHYLALLPVPIMCLFLAWGTVHNDVALDSTAVWLHVAAHVPGRADRLGRVVPPLALGLLVLAVGVPMGAWGFGSSEVAASLLGAGLCVLLVGLGVSSVVSARYPYPAVRPGDSPFAQPQASGSRSSWAQALSFSAILVLSAPTLGLGLVAVGQGGYWHLAALGAGVVTGFLVLWGGVSLGGRIFAARGPELLAFTSRY